MTAILFDPDARREFLEAVRFYEDRRLGLGLSFRQLIEAGLQQISEAPFRYRVIRAPFRRYVLLKFPYSIIYTIEPDHLRVIAVAHNKRKPGYWQSRTGD